MLASPLIILLLPWIHVLADTCPSPYSQSSYKIQGYVIETHSMQTSNQCNEKCASHGDCHSVNYYSSQGICELNNANHLTNPESLVYSSGSRYINYGFLRPLSRCSNKLCSHPLVCVIDNNNEDGYKCSTCKVSDKKEVLSFPRKSTLDKVVYENPFVQLTAFTISMWIQLDASTDVHSAFGYATVSEYNEILISLENRVNHKTIFWINGQMIYFPTSVVDGKWHHICATWENVDGNYTMYIDGKREGNVRSAKKGHVIGKGVVILGQDQDSYKGGFQESQAFQGSLTSVNMWDKVLTTQEISALASKCPSGEGNVIKWADFWNKLYGNVEMICSPFCK